MINCLNDFSTEMKLVNKQHVASVDFRNKSVIEHVESKDLLSSKSASKESILQSHQKYLSMSVKADETQPNFGGSTKFNSENYGIYTNDGKKN